MWGLRLEQRGWKRREGDAHQPFLTHLQHAGKASPAGKKQVKHVWREGLGVL